MEGLKSIKEKIVPREVESSASCERSEYFKQRYLDAPLMVDIEYIKLLTDSNKRTEGMDSLVRHAEDHAYAISHLTSVIHEKDFLVGNKTRFIRGAIPYSNYSTESFLEEIRKLEKNISSDKLEQGTGGGIQKTRELAGEKGFLIISEKFLITEDDLDTFKEICRYWKDKSFHEQASRIWKKNFPEARFIEDGWKIRLYTTPHEPCPEGRLILDFETALMGGYRSIIAKIKEKTNSYKDVPGEDADRLEFLNAALKVLQGAIQYAHNYANEAERQMKLEPDPARREELQKISEICRRVPMDPPRNFREALQSFWFTYILGHIEGSFLGYSPGRLDMVLYPYFKNDTNCTYEQAVSLFEELFVKMTQIEYIASLGWQGLGHGNLFQNLILGGVDENGNPVNNELSLAILQAQINMQMTQPTLSVWWNEDGDETFFLRAVECVKTGVGYPAFFNQKTYIEHETRTSGLPLEVVRKYSAIGGCTEPTLQGMSYGIVQAGFVNHGKILDLAMNGGVDPMTGIRMFEERKLVTYEEVKRYYLDIMHVAVRNFQRYWNHAMVAHRNTVPLIFCSVFVNDCIETGKCMDDGGARLQHSITTLSSGLVNVANSLAVIRKLCFEDQSVTLEGMMTAVRENWKGHEPLRKKVMSVPHFGNDDDNVDSIYIELFDDYCRWVKGENNYLGVPYDPSMLAISTPVPFGMACDAFPDGRYTGEPLADGVTSPFPGTDVMGPTAVIRSSSKVDHTKIRGGLLNLKFHPSALKGEKGSKNLLALIKTYFEKPGFHIQFNIVDSRMLKDARERPENYRDLIVRVAGFSAYWVEMSRALQDQVIWRTEHNML